MISNLQFRFRDLFFDSHEFFSRFSIRNPPSAICPPQSAFVGADFSDNQTAMLPLEFKFQRDSNIELEFLDVGKTNRIATVVY